MSSPPDGMPALPDANDLDVGSATTFEEFAILLQRLRVRYGEPSLRELENRSITATTGRRNIALSRTAMSDVLKGSRPASHDFLVSFLDALGMPAMAQQPWLTARTKIAESRLPAVDTTPDHGESPVETPTAPTPPALPEPPSIRAPAATRLLRKPTPMRFPRKKTAMWFGGGAAMAGVGAALFIFSSDRPVTMTMNCVPGCTVASPRLMLSGHLSDNVPSTKRPVVLTQGEGSDNWYLGPAIIAAEDGHWSRELIIGNPKPQPKDRHFTICIYLLRSTSIDQLTELMLANAGSGLPREDLPSDREELACTSAIRLKNA